MLKLGVSYAEERPLTAPLPLCGDLKEAALFAKSIGLDGIEIHGRECEFEGKRLEYIRQICSKTGIRIAALVTGRLYNQTHISLAEPEAARRKWVIEQVKKYIDSASSLKTDIIIGWLRGRITADNPSELYFGLLRESLSELDEYAGKKGVRILLEVINRYEVDCFLTAEETLAFIQDNNLKNTYLHLDTFHMNIEETDLCRALRIASEKLGYVHVADNTRLYPGSGSLDFAKILSTLDEIGYSGFVTTECFPVPDGRQAAEKAAAYLRGLMAGKQ